MQMFEMWMFDTCTTVHILKKTHLSFYLCEDTYGHNTFPSPLQYPKH